MGADYASPLAILLMRALAKTWVGAPGIKRQSLSDWLRQLSPDPMSDSGDLYSAVENIIEALPAEVWIAKGGCGGEPTVACFTGDGSDEMLNRCLGYWAVDDRMWPGLERVPLIKR